MKKTIILLVAIMCLVIVGCSNNSGNKNSISTEITSSELETPIEGSLYYEDLQSDELSEERGHMEFEDDIVEEEFLEEEILEEELLEEEFLEEEFLEEEFLEEEFLEEEFNEDEFVEEEDE